MSYKNMKVWKLARDLVIDIHTMTLSKLLKFEMYEVGAQIRRSSKSIKSNIVEGYGRRRYKHDFIRFLVFAHASCDETIDHLETLAETNSLTDLDLHNDLHNRLESLSRGFNKFIAAVESKHEPVREDQISYQPQQNPAHL